ncbi:palmitoyltransferase for Vac8p [Ptychographa xylographoides]|nr:palmitoyltransferase for Vac8p [Ptychographa xylographoides]
MMASRLSSPSPPPAKRRSKGFARKCERCCWTFVTHMPLAFVYGLTTWAVFVEYKLSTIWVLTSWKGYIAMFAGISLYVLLNWSYTTAVFTDPGSPLNPSSPSTAKGGYSHLPTHEPTAKPDLPSFTVKSTGGLKNYKAFLLFCIYTSVFCWVCFFVSGASLWTEIANDRRFDDGLLPVNMVLLAVLAGILGLVLTGFTVWHISLAWRGQTTIECLEKTRYLSPLRKSIQKAEYGVSDHDGTIQTYGQQLAEIHANALPGVTRIEEGEERPSPTVRDLEQGLIPQDGTVLTYDDVERNRERQRYEDYLDEQDSEKLPNAFDLGWKRNLTHLFGEQPLLWFFPICNTTGDGWHWIPSPTWLEAREEIRRAREAQWREQEAREERAGWGGRGRQPITPQARTDGKKGYLTTSTGVLAVSGSGSRSPNKADRVLGRSPNQYVDGNFDDDARPGSGMSMRTLRRKDSFEHPDGDDEDNYEVSSDEESAGRRTGHKASNLGQHSSDEWREWD